MSERYYPVGTPGTAWGDPERAEWLKTRTAVKRSYEDDVLAKLELLKTSWNVEQVRF
jgi:hypothetical protein